MCSGTGVSFPAMGEAHRLLAVAVPAPSLWAGAAVRTGEVGWSAGVGSSLASADTKPARRPCWLHGGCTESDLIRGTRPNELITGLSSPALPKTIPPSRGGGASCSRQLRPRRACGPGGRGAGARGANSGNPWPRPVLVARAQLGGRLLAWSPPCLPKWRSSRCWVRASLPLPGCWVGSCLKPYLLPPP